MHSVRGGCRKGFGRVREEAVIFILQGSSEDYNEKKSETGSRRNEETKHRRRAGEEIKRETPTR